MSFRRLALAILSSVLLVVVGVFVAAPGNAAFLSPTLESVTPSQIIPGVANQAVTLHGDFTSGQSEVEFTPDTGITITDTPTTSDDQTTITLHVTVASDAPNTARDVTVTGGLLGSSSTCSKCITVGPQITSVSGPIANSSEAAQFVITGKAFKAPLSIQISRSSYGFGAAESDTILATNVQVTSTTITATVNPFGRAPGRWKVAIVQDNGGKASFGDGITTGMQITGSKPTLQTIIPSHIESSQTDKQFNLTGTGFARGMTATVTGSGVTQSKPISIPNNPSTGKPDTTKAILFLTSTSSPSDGPQTLILRNADGQSSTNSDAICVNCNLPTPGGDPTVSTVTPSILGQGAVDVQMIVTGTNFGSPVPLVTVSPNGTGTNLIDVRVQRDSATQLTLTVSVGSTTPAGARDLTVNNPPGGGSVTKVGAFTISTDFNVTGLTPPGRPQGYTGNFAVNGSGFTGTPSVSIVPGTDLTVGTPTVNSPAKLTVPITVGANAATTPRDVQVTSGGVTKTCSGCFTVGKVPTVLSITPDAATGGAPASITALTGTDFAPGATPTLERSGQPSIAMTETNVESPTKISGTFDLTNAAPGKWDVRVTNIDGGTSKLADGFEVTLGAPNLVSANPETIAQATTDMTMHLIGNAFAPGITVTLPEPNGVTVTSVQRLSNTAVDVKVTADEPAKLGSRDVEVKNTDGQSDICESCFVVVQGQQSKYFGEGLTGYPNFNGGAFVASGNIDGVLSNGTEFVTAPNAGGGPHVRPFRINPVRGDISELGDGFMAYEPGFTGGVRIAVGNLDGNAANGEEIITGPGPGGGPHVRMFHINNNLTVNEPFGGGFFAYEPGFTGGVSVAAVDVNGDGIDEIVTAPGPGGGPHIRVWRLAVDGHSFIEFSAWMAYDNFHGGAIVAGGNLVAEDSNKPVLQEIVTVPWISGGPHVRIFGGTGIVKREFMAFSEPDSRGYQVTAGDFDFDTVDDIAVSKNGATEVLIAQIADAPRMFIPLVSPNPQPLGAALVIGTNMAAADVDNDGDDDLVLAPNHDSAVTLRLVRPLSAT